MNPVALLGAFFAGFVASVAWCLVGYFTGYDLPPFCALVVAGIVGFGAVALDGYGVPMAFCCALVAILSVLGGKVGGVYIAMSEAREELASKLTDVRYDAMKAQASTLATLPSPEYYRDFMVENGYTENGEVSDEDLDRFTDVEAPVLRRLYLESLKIGEWKQLYAEKYLEYKVSSHTLVGLVLAELGLLDLLFGALGVALTFTMVITAGQARPRTVPRLTKAR